MEKRKPKVFILGASGFLGYTLARYLREDFLVSGAYFQHRVVVPDAQIYPIDPKKPEIIETLVRIQAPDLVVNAVGITDRAVIAANPKLADTFNILSAVSLAALANKMRAPFVQLSCTSVYDGSDGNYSEENLDFALYDELGKQKLAAESYIRAQTMESTILRVGPVLGLGLPYRPPAFDKFRLSLAAKKKVEASKRTVNSYLSTRSFAEAIGLVLKSGSAGRHRILNLGGPALSEFDLYQGWARLLGLESNVIPPGEETSRNCSVKSDAFKKAFPEWKQESKEMLYLNLFRELTPGLGAKKWQKTLQIP